MKIFRRFVDEGKCTISFKTPEIDLHIKADHIQLKAFLNAVKTILCPQDPSKSDTLHCSTNLKTHNTRVIPIEVVTKLIIKERAGFAGKGFPRTLKELAINNVGCSQMPIGILNLSSLNSLDLTNNNIQKLPKPLGRLRLSKLILNENFLGEAVALKDWDWLFGDNLRKSLTCLSIAKNKLKFIPINVVQCKNIVQLDVSFNEIRSVPFAVKEMSQLRSFNISNNQISSLPYTFIKLWLDEIDLSQNPLQVSPEVALGDAFREVFRHQFQIRASTLLELSANAIIKHRVPYASHNIPLICKDIITYSPLCANSKCEALCFDRNIFRNVTLIELNAKKRLTNANQRQFNADGPFCSLSCGRVVFKKFGNPLPQLNH